jgi:4-alpha-glucanotransferase
VTPRRAGLLVPLFSLRSARGWGIGEIGDIAGTARWLESAGLSLLQLLPINELPLHETSPYSSLSAMAIDPQYITLDDVEDFAALGGERGMEAELRANLEGLRVAPSVNYAGVRRLKHLALRRAYERFRDTELRSDSERAHAFRAYVEEEAWWLADYALFRALHERTRQPWTEWPEGLRTHHPVALAGARAELADDVRYREYVLWLASDQWHAARAAAEPVALFGDLPFMVALDSADVWARQHDFRLDASLGVPPDAFSDDGQDWKLPVYQWDTIAAGGFAWLRQRARRNAELFGGYRVDHLVGFYRTFWRPLGDSTGPGSFTPSDEPAQIALGEQVLGLFLESGAEIVAEDLGLVPDFVRESLARLQVPGCKVFRWERRWHTPDRPFVDPLTYPSLSMATSGTHDTEPMVTWWETAPDEERAAVLNIPLVAERLGPDGRREALESRALLPAVRDAFIEVLIASSSELVIVPVGDVFGWSDRINTPATVNDRNWTWRMPWPAERLAFEPDAIAAVKRLREWCARYGRTDHRGNRAFQASQERS